MSNKHLAWLLGIGLILFIWHNPYQPLLSYAFLPWIGLCLILLVEAYAYKTNKLTLGPKGVWITLVVIAGSIIISGIAKWFRQETDINTVIAITCTAIMLFTLYPVSRVLGKDIFTPFVFAVPIEAISIVVFGALHQWLPNGGLLSPTNYDIAIGLLIFGFVTCRSQWQKWLLPFTILGILFSGAAEGLFALAVLATVWIYKNRKGILTNSTFQTYGTLTLLALAILLYTNIWNITLVERVQAGIKAITDGTSRPDLLYFASGHRIGETWQISPILPFGHGYNMMNFYKGIPHNIILIIIEQVGIIAAIAWLRIAISGVRTSWSLVWIGFISLGVFDHFIWTQAAPWFWVLAGVTSIIEEKRPCLTKPMAAQSVASKLREN